MKCYLNLMAAAAAAFVSIAATPVAAQAPPGVYWSGDICRAAQAHEARRGTRTGALVGGAIGAAASRSVGGALIGGTAGALVGSAVGRSRIRCVAPPPRHSRRHNCQWVQDWVHGRWQTFEVCRGRDGFWRPSGR